MQVTDSSFFLKKNKSTVRLLILTLLNEIGGSYINRQDNHHSDILTCDNQEQKRNITNMLKGNRTGTGEKIFTIHSYAYRQMVTDSFKKQFTNVLICPSF